MYTKSVGGTVPFPVSGCPAVIRIESPTSASPTSLEYAEALLNISSILNILGSIYGTIPLVIINFLALSLSGKTASTGIFGRYLAMKRAVVPDFV